MRLDLYIAENNLAESRTEAKKLISVGAVTVNGRIINKPSYDVTDSDIIAVDRSSIKYVSRGGLKLEAALVEFSVDVAGSIALDVGASSGGFTDCLLQHGASKVVAVDSGSGQMNDKLRSDSRVTVIENYNARYMKRSDFGVEFNLAVMDVSFISATLIMPSVYSVLTNGAIFICLIKPQFEVGRSGLSKGGIVKDERLRTRAVEDVIASASACGFSLIGCIKSPIEGGDGNVEYLACFAKEHVFDENSNISSK